ncbi:MAG: pirin family protein [Tumebacillaceae bacterium]
MINIIPAESRYTGNHGWLTARFSFSFSEYYDPSNIQWSAMRVLNDDIIQPGTGFGTHPHRDMEIVTYVIDGALEHKDSMGNIGVIHPGEMQRMTAGTGVTHSEYNHSDKEPVNSLQMWFFPNEQGLTPSWEQKQFTREQKLNKLFPAVSGEPSGETMIIHQDMTIYLSDLEAGHEVTHTQAPGRHMHLFIIKGEVSLNGEQHMKERDAARIKDLDTLTIATEQGAEFMLIDLP